MKNLFIPLSVIIGCMVIAGAILFSGGNQSAPPKTQTATAVAGTPTPPPPISAEGLRRSEQAHVYGNADAKVTVVEFSDFECPYCARLHPTLKRIVDESSGKINWEYRHLPLPNHVNARTGAIASECVAALKGQQAFFTYAERLLTTIGQHSDAFHKKEALALGVLSTDYDSCIKDAAKAALVDGDLGAAQKAGGSGTPYSLIIKDDNTVVPVVGAVPYEQWLALLK